MGPDEVAILLLSSAVALFAVVRWYVGVARVDRLVCTPGLRRAMRLAPLAAVATILLVLVRWSASDVRGSAGWILYYLVLGIAWLGAATRLLPLVGLQPRDDVLERRNPAAMIAVAGAIEAFALCYAGGNIGDGPGWWVVVFSAGLATATLLIALLVLAALGGADARIAIDRDQGAGVRYAALCIASGLLLGRGAAGTWHGVDGALHDFSFAAWPIAIIVAIEIVASRVPRRIEPREHPGVGGVAPVLALVYVGVAAFRLARLGWWS
ncbi:MAG: hypothetical protein U0575_11910 [Phycisphaerales bacterium]